MFLDSLDNADRYAGMHPGFDAAFRFLRRPDLAALPAGRHPVDGDRVFAIVGRDEGKGRDAARLEAHRKYVDIQYVVSGREVIGWRPLSACAGTGEGYSEEKEIEFFTARPGLWVDVLRGHFAVFFPEDAHAPLAGQGPVHKVVMKVAR